MRTRKPSEQLSLPPTEGLPSPGVEEAPGPPPEPLCKRCEGPSDCRGPVTKPWVGDRWWWLHPVCAAIVKAEFAR
jgi:hypothetical protein